MRTLQWREDANISSPGSRTPAPPTQQSPPQSKQKEQQARLRQDPQQAQQQQQQKQQHQPTVRPIRKGLTPDHFRHPLDQQNTQLLRALPGVELVAKAIMGPVAEQVLVMENMASSIKTGPQQLASIHALLVDAASTLQMDSVPDLYVRQSPHPNAYTLAINGRHPFIVVHTALVELLSPQELKAVIAHELAHVACDHGVWLTLANALASGTASLLPVVSDTVQDALLRWRRAVELTCDRAALLAVQDCRVVVGALMKLAGGCPSLAHELSVDAFLEQARSYDQAAASSLIGWYFSNAHARALSHPLPVMRAREVDRWAQSEEYRRLVAGRDGR